MTESPAEDARVEPDRGDAVERPAPRRLAPLPMLQALDVEDGAGMTCDLDDPDCVSPDALRETPASTAGARDDT